MWLAAGSILTLIVTVFICFVKWCQTYWERRGLRQLKPGFFIGNARKIITGEISVNDAFLDFYSQFKKMGEKHGGIYSLLEAVYIPVDPIIVKNIMQRDFDHFLGHGFYHDSCDVLSMHLFNLEGEPWKRLRSKLTPTFSSGKIKAMLDILLEKSAHLHKVMDDLLEKNETITVKDALSRYTTDIIGSCAFGIECNSLEEPNCHFRKAGTKAIEMRLLHFLVSSLAPWSLLRAIKFNFTDYYVTKFFSKVVKETIEYREKNAVSRNDFMQLLIELKNKGTLNGNMTYTEIPNVHRLTENEIIAQCFVFFIGGYETSSTVMNFALFELARNQEIQEKLREEINTVLNKHNGKITYDGIKEMSYLEMVAHETLRKYPPLPTVTRRCTKDYQVPGTNVIIQKGILLHIPIWGIHKDPEYYPNPEVFNPENFNEENKAKRQEFTYLPFGGGPRMCIGLRFGMLQIKVGLISLIGRYKLTMNEKTPMPLVMDNQFFLAAKGDVWFNVTKIK